MNIGKGSLVAATLILALGLFFANLCLARAPFAKKPDFDSGWLTLQKGYSRTLVHNLGGNADDYLVDMQQAAYSVPARGYLPNHAFYGGNDYGANSYLNEDDRVGTYWSALKNNTISVTRRWEDPHAQRLRVRIWKTARPDYDSGWVDIAQGTSITLTHNLGGDANAYFVDMQTKSTLANQMFFGGFDCGKNALYMHEDDRIGAYWLELSGSTIIVYRRPEDPYTNAVRVRIWKEAGPDYDSGWVDIAQGTSTTLTHNLGGKTDNYVVDMMFKGGPVVSVINKRYYGGADIGAHPPPSLSEDDRVGAYWRSLTNSSINVVRRHEDIYARQVRVRIWNYAPSYYVIPLPNGKAVVFGL